MATKIGTAYITIDADTKPFTKGLSTMSRGLGGVLKGVAKISAGIVGLGATVGALALRAGIDRALNIEDAEARMRGLDYSVKQIDKIMEVALQSVLGTQFRLDEAATIAAGAVAAGIDPATELAGFLELTADAAFEAGTSLKEMGDILVRDQAMGRIYTRDLNQLATRGLPVWQLLADHFGVTGTALRKLVADGEVSAELYREILVDKIGGASDESAKTTRGAYKNMGAAMARFGQQFVEPFLPMMKDVFAGITKVWDRAAVDVDDFVERMLNTPVFEWLEEKAKNIPETFGKISDALFGLEGDIERVAGLRPDWEGMAPSPGLLDRLKTTFQPIIDGVVRMFKLFQQSRRRGKSFGTSIIMALENGVRKVLNWISSGGLLVITEAIIKSFERRTEFLTALLDLFRTILIALPDILRDLIAWVDTSLVPVLIDTIENVLPQLFDSLILILTQAFIGLDKVLPDLIDAIENLIEELSDSLANNGPMMFRAASDLFITLIDGLGSILPALLRVITHDLLPELGRALVRLSPSLVTAAGELFMAILDGLNIILPLLGDLLFALLDAVVIFVQENKTQIVDQAELLFTGLLDALMLIIPPLVDVLIEEVLPAVIDALLRPDVAKTLTAGAVLLFSELATALAGAIPSIVERITDPHNGVIREIVKGLTSDEATQAIWDATVLLFQELIEGLGQAAIDLGVYIDGPFMDDIEGFFSGLWDKLFEIGRSLFSWLWEGLKDIWYNDVIPWFNDVIDLINRALPEAIEIPNIGIVREGLGIYGGEPTYNADGSVTIPSDDNKGGRNYRRPPASGPPQPPYVPPEVLGAYAATSTTTVNMASGAVTINNPTSTVDVEDAITRSLNNLANTRATRGALVY